MRIAIAGGSGFLGRALAGRLLAEGHELLVLGRSRPGSAAPAQAGVSASAGPTRITWSPDGTVGAWAEALDGLDAVVNLAGESIAAGRWSAAQKRRILDSRLLATRSLARAIRAARRPPAVFVTASAVGYYGSRGDEILNEESSPGTDFLARLCVEWEREAREALPAAKRVVPVRGGIVLDAAEGALARMLAPFRLYAGGPIGSGRQWVSWIHRDDWVSVVRLALTDEQVDGPLNATAPNPVTNADFARALGRALHVPSVLPVPAAALRLAFGEMAEALLLCSQRVLPVRASALGFRFAFPDVAGALGNLL
jgi:uncharacterized protein (TIGR01777 family)